MTIFVEGLDIGRPGGLKVAIKDTIDVAGHATRCGSRAMADVAPAARNAAVVDRLIDAGCHIVGKTTLHELAFGISGMNDWAGTPINPRFPDLIPGGSSSGSAAAVAAGLVDFAVGTDTGGSIRFPAACCGLWGLKPSFGRVSRRGIAPARTSLDCVGPLADSLDMVVAAMELLDPTFVREEVPRARLGVVDVSASPHILEARDAFVEASGMDPEVVELGSLEAAFAAGLTIINAETFAAFGSRVGTGLLGPDVDARLRTAGRTTPDDVARAEAVRAAFTAEVDALLETFDAILLPTIGDDLPTVGQARSGDFSVALTRFVRPFNLSGHPALAIPLVGARPMSMQLVGTRGQDARLCAIASQL